MKAFRIDAPGRFSFGTADRPVLQSDEILLRVERVGFCGSDLSTFRGRNALVSYPRIPGHEVAGTVVEKGSQVPTDIEIGTAATVIPYTACGVCSACAAGRSNACRDNQTLGVQREGALTDFIAVEWRKLVRAPFGLRELALIEPLSVGFHAVDRANITAQETVLVLGCGMIGLGAIAGAGLERHACVIAADIADEKLALARLAGASHALRSDDRDFARQLAALVPEGPAVVIEAVGQPSTYELALEAVAFAGRVVGIGYAATPFACDTGKLVKKELDMRGSRNATLADFERVSTMLSAGRYPASRTVTQTVGWDQAGQVLADWSAHPGRVTKIQVEVNPSP
jgi:L-galactonate 5-dehydrogenase